MRVTLAGLLAALLLTATGIASAATSTELDALKRDVEDLRRRVMAQQAPAARSSVDTVLENKYGPNAPVTTRTGKLQIGGLVQVWYYHINQDNRGLFDSPGSGGAIVDSNAASDNDSFRIRRAELSFKMDVHENITSFVMIDPAREAASFPSLPIGLKTINNVSPQFDGVNGPGLGNTSTIGNVQTGGGRTPYLLQDALINYHGVIPHHDLTVGQYLPTFNEESFSPDSMQDFAERSFIGGMQNDVLGRDLGATIHGSWWGNGAGGPYCGGGDQGRAQYWLSIFDSAANYLGTGGQDANRSNSNSQFDFLGTALVRPLWCEKSDEWQGKLELGGSAGFGKHGKDGGILPDEAPTSGLNRERTFAVRYDGWFKYMPGGPVRGMWLKGELDYLRDRNAPDSVVDMNGAGTGNFANAQEQGHVLGLSGAWVAVGYKLSDSIYSDCNQSWLRSMEFAFRFEDSQNVEIAAANPVQTNAYYTEVFSPEINYYIKGHNAKIQAMYNQVVNPEGPAYAHFHNVSASNFILNFQVMW
jgi:hypothetical protein